MIHVRPNARDDEPAASTTDYEKSLIGCAIRDQECAARLIAEVPPHYFRDEFHRETMRTAVSQWGSDGIFDPLRIGKSLRTKYKSESFDPVLYLAELASYENLATTSCFESRLREVVNAGVKQRIYSATDHASKSALNGASPDDILRTLRADLEDIEADSDRPIELRKASSYESRPIDWAWTGYLHRGGLTMFDGDPERGKSTITTDVVARWTYPRPFPFTVGDNFREAGNALIVANEDGIETTSKPRLEAAGANLDRVYFWPEDADPITFPSGVDKLASVVKRHNIGLVIFDPITAYLDDTVNANRDSEVRGALRQLVAVAQETNLAVIGIRHLNKDANKPALYRGGGSIAFTAQARVVWAVGSDPADPSRSVLAVLKSNIGKKPPAITYSIESHGDTSRVKWEGESTCTASEIFETKRPRGAKTEDAERLLLDLLKDGPRPESEVRQSCSDAGVKDWTYKQARKRLEIVSSKGSMREGWLLSLPEEDGFDAEEVGIA